MARVATGNFLDFYPFQQHRLDNGLEVLLLHNPVSPVAAFLTLYKVGSASETPRQRGLAHFFEHMMFRETETLGDGDFDRIMSEIGGVGLNAFTAYDMTAYHVNVPTVHLGRVIELEADRMVNLRLSAEVIERERGAVLGEMKMYKDMPSEQLWEALMAAAFTEHPYRHPIIGYLEQVSAFGDGDFTAFYRRHYAPNRAVVVVAGGIEPAETLTMLERAYGGLAPGAALPPPAPAEGPWRETRRVELKHAKISTESLAVAFRSPGLAHADMPALILLSALLAAGQSSPLYRRLVVGGLATHVSASPLETEMMLCAPGLLILEASLRHGVAAEKAEAGFDGVLREAGERGWDGQELQRAHNQIKLSFYSGMRTNMNLARQLGGYTVACNDPLFSEKLLEAVAGVSVEQVAAVLDRYLLNAPRLVAVQRPPAGGVAA